MAERALLRPFFQDITFTTGQEKEFIFPQFHYNRLTILVLAKDTPDTADDMNIDIQLNVLGTFADLDGATSGTVVRNIIFIFTNEDVHGELKVKLTAGTVPPAQKVDIVMFGYRV